MKKQTKKAKAVRKPAAKAKAKKASAPAVSPPAPAKENLGGRPTTFTASLAAQILAEVRTSPYSIAKICELRGNDFPAKSTVYKWLAENPEFSDQYARAKETQAHLLAEEIIEIADDDSKDVITWKDDEGHDRQTGNPTAVSRAKLQIDTRKWVLAKLLPKKYGDKIEVKQTGKGSRVVQVELPRKLPLASVSARIAQREAAAKGGKK